MDIFEQVKKILCDQLDLDEEQLKAMGLSDEDIKEVNDSVEIEEEDEFECPNCHQMVPEGSTVCPFCGAEFEFE